MASRPSLAFKHMSCWHSIPVAKHLPKHAESAKPTHEFIAGHMAPRTKDGRSISYVLHSRLRPPLFTTELALRESYLDSSYVLPVSTKTLKFSYLASAGVSQPVLRIKPPSPPTSSISLLT